MSDSILDIIRKISPDFPVEELLKQAGGREWYLPAHRRDFKAIRQAIKADPCRDYRTIARKYKVSITLVYSVWREPAA